MVLLYSEVYYWSMEGLLYFIREYFNPPKKNRPMKKKTEIVLVFAFNHHSKLKYFLALPSPQVVSVEASSGVSASTWYIVTGLEVLIYPSMSSSGSLFFFQSSFSNLMAFYKINGFSIIWFFYSLIGFVYTSWF